MKEIIFHDSFSPTGATDSVTYDNGSFQSLGRKSEFAADGKAM